MRMASPLSQPSPGAPLGLRRAAVICAQQVTCVGKWRRRASASELSHVAVKRQQPYPDNQQPKRLQEADRALGPDPVLHLIHQPAGLIKVLAVLVDHLKQGLLQIIPSFLTEQYIFVKAAALVGPVCMNPHLLQDIQEITYWPTTGE